MQKVERFKIINDCLGYGNPNANIMFIGIEENGEWSIYNILNFSDNRYNDVIKELKKEPISFEAKINILIKNNIDIEELLDKSLIEMNKRLMNNIYPCIPKNTEGSIKDTTGFQFRISQLLLNLSNEDWKNFGTKYGNEACLNYYPIGRHKVGYSYEEKEYFFGIKGINKIPRTLIDIREKHFENLFYRLKKKVDMGEKVFIFIMGKNKQKQYNSNSHILFPIIKRAFKIKENSLENLDDYCYNLFNKEYIIYRILEKHLKIFFMPHPSNNNIKIQNIIGSMCNVDL